MINVFEWITWNIKCLTSFVKFAYSRAPHWSCVMLLSVNIDDALELLVGDFDMQTMATLKFTLSEYAKKNPQKKRYDSIHLCEHKTGRLSKNTKLRVYYDNIILSLDHPAALFFKVELYLNMRLGDRDYIHLCEHKTGRLSKKAKLRVYYDSIHLFEHTFCKTGRLSKKSSFVYIITVRIHLCGHKTGRLSKNTKLRVHYDNIHLCEHKTGRLSKNTKLRVHYDNVYL